MKPMINPRLLRPAHKRWNLPQFAGGKIYFAIFTDGQHVMRARTVFKRAGEAETYAKRLLARWIPLYDAALKARAAVPAPEQP